MKTACRFSGRREIIDSALQEMIDRQADKKFRSCAYPASPGFRSRRPRAFLAANIATMDLRLSTYYILPPKRHAVCFPRAASGDSPDRTRKDVMTNLIELHGLSKIFQTEEVETHALADIHLRIARGEYVAVAGPSGCGKSTLLSILGLLDTPTGGTYLLNGQPVQALSRSARADIRNQEIGFIFQAFNLIGDLTVHENVTLSLTYRDGISAAERKKRAAAALDRVGLSHRANHFPWQLSGGQQQRVAVARAIAGQPSILLADEPTGNLDSKNAQSVMELLRELHRDGSTICMVTHDSRFVDHAGRTVHLFDGRIIEEVVARPAPEARVVTTAPPLPIARPSLVANP
jgi:putative ABC transport system ATP-binding protein